MVNIDEIDRAQLYRMIRTEVAAFAWRGLGPDASSAAIENALTSNVLSQFAFTAREDNQILGLAQLALPNFAHGTAQLTGLLRQSYQNRVWPLEGFVLFLNYAFHAYSIRKIYAEVPERNVEAFGAGLGRFFEREGTLERHGWHQGDFRSVTYYGLERSDFEVLPVVVALLDRARRAS